MCYANCTTCRFNKWSVKDSPCPSCIGYSKWQEVSNPGSFSSLQEKVHKTAIEHGWWEERRPIPELLCLIHSEVSEALECYRHTDDVGFNEELADIIIRVMDLAEFMKIDLEKEIIKKNEYNKTREYRHGGKRC